MYIWKGCKVGIESCRHQSRVLPLGFLTRVRVRLHFVLHTPRMQGSENLGFRVQDSVFSVQGAGCRIQGSEFMVRSSGFRVRF